MSLPAYDLNLIAMNPAFQARVNYAMVTAAIAVMAEVNTTTGHTLRVAFASKVLSGTASVIQYALGVMSNSTIAGEATASPSPTFAIPDSDIQFTVNSLFSAYSGVAL